MQKIKTEEFEKKLQELDKRIVIVPNSNRPGASNVFLNGVDICTWIPQFEIQDEATPDYVYKLNDIIIPFKTTGQIIDIVKNTIDQMKNPEYSDIFFDNDSNIINQGNGEQI